MSLIKKPSEIVAEATNLKVLVYGQPGIGKTTYGLGATDPLLLDCDNGIRRVLPQHRRDNIPVKSWADIMGMLTEDLSPYRTLVIDTIGKLLDYLAESLVKDNPKYGAKNGGLSLQGYGALKNQFVSFLARCNSLNKHLVFISHDKEGKEGDDMVVRPDITGSSMGIVIREMDLVGYMESRANRRSISFNPTDRFYGKNTCQLPDVIAADDMPLDKIFTTYQAHLSKQNIVIADYDSLLKDFLTKMHNVTSAQDCQAFLSLIDGGEHIWDSKLLLKTKFAGYIKKAGIRYDKATQSFVDPKPKKKTPKPKANGIAEPKAIEPPVTTQIVEENKSIFDE